MLLRVFFQCSVKSAGQSFEEIKTPFEHSKDACTQTDQYGRHSALNQPFWHQNQYLVLLKFGELFVLTHEHTHKARSTDDGIRISILLASETENVRSSFRVPSYTSFQST